MPKVAILVQMVNSVAHVRPTIFLDSAASAFVHPTKYKQNKAIALIVNKISISMVLVAQTVL